MACSPGSWRLHVRPKLDNGGRMYAIVVHLTMFASVKHFPAIVHFEAGHCKRQEPGKQAIDPGQPASGRSCDFLMESLRRGFGMLFCVRLWRRLVALVSNVYGSTGMVYVDSNFEFEHEALYL